MSYSPEQTTPRLLVLLSGSGRTLVNLHDQIERGLLDAVIAGVIASRPCGGVERATELGIPVTVEPDPLGAEAIEGLMHRHDADWTVLAGYLQLIGVPDVYRGRIVNIHPALLPSFGGTGMYGDRVHRAVIDAGCRVSGCTVHLVDEKYDCGPIVLQRACPVLDDDTPETLARRVFMLECSAYPEALRHLLAGRVLVEGQRTWIEPDPL